MKDSTNELNPIVEPKSECHAGSDSEASESRDANIVDWDGPHDAENPMNWGLGKVVVSLSIVCVVTFLSSLASSIFAPGIPQVLEDFKSTSSELGSFIVTVYVIGYVFGPLLIAPLSEIYGRSPLYLSCLGLFVVFNVACALAPSLPALVAFRLFAGLGGSAPLALSVGTIADIIAYKNRGKVAAVWNVGPMLGPIIGPIAGGYLIEAKGWRWSFWLVAIASGAVFIFSLFFLRETYAYAILNRRVSRLRKQTGNPYLRSALYQGGSAIEKLKKAIIRPTKMLTCSPTILLISFIMFLFYGYFYLLFTAMPVFLQAEYGFSTGSIGLTYIGPGVGSFVALLISGSISDRLARRMTKPGTAPKPEYRVPLLVAASFIVPIGLFWTGWTAESHQHWILPIIGTSILSVGVTLAFMSSTTYLIDAYTLYAASAIAATTFLRSLGGALLPLAGGPMFAALGMGWGSSLLAFVAVAVLPMPIILLRYGERIRQKTLFDVKF
ncbi:hypothetical protein DL771_002496 [Monosporascus sp. 5C6A]|nr:hypothetical protein DL771_002496 [Monosporascus sp. 5C6A]